MPSRLAANSFLRGVLIAVLALPAAAAMRRETLIRSQFDIDPGEWRYFEFPSKEKGARLSVEFEVVAPKGAAGVRVAVLSEQEFQRFRDNQPHQAIGTTSYRRDGALRERLAEPGGYAVVIDNRMQGRRTSRVDLEISLMTGPDPETLPVSYASPRKRLIVVSVSLAAFLTIVGLSSQALLRAAANRRRGPPAPPLWS